MNYHIGIDDTDSASKGMCTTYLGAKVLRFLLGKKAMLLDYPLLVRLNPNIPFRTRGNGAVCLRFEATPKVFAEVKDFALGLVARDSVLDDEKTNPGVVFLQGSVPRELKAFYSRALHEVLEVGEAERLCSSVGVEFHKFKNGRGIIGALAAVGAELKNSDYTFEFLAYRFPENCGRKRKYGLESVTSMNEAFADSTFANIYKKKPRLFPAGKDPVFCGVRGETPEAVARAFKALELNEELDFGVVWRSNQGTDAHLNVGVKTAAMASPFTEAKIHGVVAAKPEYYGSNPGKRHVRFALSDESGRIECVAYAPTREFRSAAAALLLGDEVWVGGGVRNEGNGFSKSLNLEKFYVKRLAPLFTLESPSCRNCGGRTSSLGTGKGFKCKKCGSEDAGAAKKSHKLKRDLAEGMEYVVPTCALRHLTKPAERFGREKKRFSLAKPLTPSQVFRVLS